MRVRILSGAVIVLASAIAVAQGQNNNPDSTAEDRDVSSAAESQDSEEDTTSEDAASKEEDDSQADRPGASDESSDETARDSDEPRPRETERSRADQGEYQRSERARRDRGSAHDRFQAEDQSSSRSRGSERERDSGRGRQADDERRRDTQRRSDDTADRSRESRRSDEEYRSDDRRRYSAERGAGERRDSRRIDRDPEISFSTSQDRLIISGLPRRGPAVRAGLRARDQIISIDGQRVTSRAQFNRYVRDADDRIPIVVLRDGRRQTIYWNDAEDADRRGDAWDEGQVADRSEESRESAFLGVVFDTRYDDAAVVRQVYPNSPAQRAGMRSGYTILSINGDGVTCPEDVTEMVEEMEPGEPVELQVSQGPPRRLEVELGTRRERTYAAYRGEAIDRDEQSGQWRDGQSREGQWRDDQWRDEDQWEDGDRGILREGFGVRRLFRD